MFRIIESKYITSAVKPSSYPDTVWKDFAFVGRSNVGKSSMINTLTNRKLLAKIANKPGKTRLINFFEIKFKLNDTSPPTPPFKVGQNETSPPTPHSEVEQIGYFGLVDLPGYGYARVSKAEKEQWQTMINTFFKNRQQLAGAVVLIDIRHEADHKDVMMIKMLQELNINFMIAATKCDKIPKNKVFGQLKMFKQVFGISNIIEFSSLKKIGIDKVLNWIESIILHIPTPVESIVPIDNTELIITQNTGQKTVRVFVHDKETIDA